MAEMDAANPYTRSAVGRLIARAERAGVTPEMLTDPGTRGETIRVTLAKQARLPVITDDIWRAMLAEWLERIERRRQRQK